MVINKQSVISLQAWCERARIRRFFKTEYLQQKGIHPYLLHIEDIYSIASSPKVTLSLFWKQLRKIVWSRISTTALNHACKLILKKSFHFDFIRVWLKCSYFWETISPIQLNFASFCFSDWNCHEIINGADVLRIEVLR